MTEVQVQIPKSIPLYPVRSSSASSVASSLSSDFSNARKLSEGDQPALSDAVSRLLSQQSYGEVARLAVKTGIPSDLRAQAWPELLKSHPYVVNPSIAHEFPVAPELPSEKRLRGDIRRLMQKTCRSMPAEQQSTFSESIFTAVWSFLAKYKLQYESGLAWVAWTLANAMNQQEIDPQVFEHACLVILHAEPALEPRGPGDNEVADAISHFMTVFRQFLPELSGHFDREFMCNFFVGEEWMVWWIKWYGVKAFAVPDLARLWDSYFGFRPEAAPSLDQDPDATPKTTPLAALPIAAIEPRKLHIFCCLAIMKANSNKLMELDQSEAHHLLMHLPVIKNFEAVLVEAHGMLQKAEEGR